MSVASSFPYTVKIPSSPSSPSSTSPPSSSSSSSSSLVRLCSSSRTSSKPFARTFHVVRSSQTEGPIRRPMAPSPTPPLNKPQPPETASTVKAPEKPVSAASVTADDKNVITLEFQRVKAKELQEYFKKKKLEEANRGPFFGFVGNNEIGNGRWAMFGFAVGLLTEFATGSDLVDQVKILLSNFGIVDIE